MKPLTTLEGISLVTGPTPAGCKELAEELHTLIEACITGDPAAATRFVKRYQQRVFGLCWRMLGHREDAEDASQETFLRALRNLTQWDPRRPIEPWLLTIAANRCRTQLARRKNRPGGLPLLEADVQTSQDELSTARHLAEELERALSQVRGEYAQAFRLFHSEEFSYAEIAEAMECPLGTVKTWVHRARRELIQQLTKRGVIDPRNESLSTNRKPHSSTVGSAPAVGS